MLSSTGLSHDHHIDNLFTCARFVALMIKLAIDVFVRILDFAANFWLFPSLSSRTKKLKDFFRTFSYSVTFVVLYFLWLGVPLTIPQTWQKRFRSSIIWSDEKYLFTLFFADGGNFQFYSARTQTSLSLKRTRAKETTTQGKGCKN